MVVPRIKRADTIPVQRNHLAALVGALAFSSILVLYLYLSQPVASGGGSGSSSSVRGLLSHQLDGGGAILTDGAPPVYGTLERIKSTTSERQTEIVYALPKDSGGTVGDIKAIALLLHGCYHHGRKFFAKSTSCEKCIGLSEEMRITRILLEQKSLAVLAITSHDRVSGCWSDVDFDHIKDALDSFRNKLHIPPDGVPVLALGTSSGGVFGVQLAVRGIVDAALVGAMHLREELTHKWVAMEKKPPVYLAAMPRDKEKMEKIQANFDVMTQKSDEAGSEEAAAAAAAADHRPIVLDTTTCQSRPVDASYLNERVPKLSITAAQAIVTDLMAAGHIDSVTGLLVKDPTSTTESNWRETLKNNCGEKMGCLENQSLEVGESPLAKALNRAWAFHEYCSEVTIKALNFFEKELGGTPFLHTWIQA